MRQPPMPRGMGQAGFTLRPGLQPTGGPTSVSSQGPSPLPYAQSPQGQMGNPSPGAAVPSPVGGQNRSNSLAPSPSSQVNTPLNPASQEEREYMEKVKSLEKYIEPLRNMILRIGNDDNEKLGKMRKLLDIMSNPDKRMPLVTLQKCEDVLKRMQLDTTESDAASGGADSTLSTNTDKNPLIESILKLSQANRAGSNVNNYLSTTFLPPMEAMMGPEISLPPLPCTPPPCEDGGQHHISDILQGEIARLDSRFSVWLDSAQPRHSAGGSWTSITPTSVEVVCQLADRDLPAVPNMYVRLAANYPDTPPEINLQSPDYLSTPFLRQINSALAARLEKMPSQYTLSQLLTAWELSVRSACAPSPINNQLVNSTSLLNVN